jgi:hypothetical protein
VNAGSLKRDADFDDHRVKKWPTRTNDFDVPKRNPFGTFVDHQRAHGRGLARVIGGKITS